MNTEMEIKITKIKLIAEVVNLAAHNYYYKVNVNVSDEDSECKFTFIESFDAFDVQEFYFDDNEIGKLTKTKLNEYATYLAYEFLDLHFGFARENNDFTMQDEKVKKALKSFANVCNNTIDEYNKIKK